MRVGVEQGRDPVFGEQRRGNIEHRTVGVIDGQ